MTTTDVMAVQKSLVVLNTYPTNIRKVQLRVIHFLNGQEPTLRLFLYMNDGSRAFIDSPWIRFEDKMITVDEAYNYATGANWEDA